MVPSPGSQEAPQSQTVPGAGLPVVSAPGQVWGWGRGLLPRPESLSCSSTLRKVREPDSSLVCLREAAECGKHRPWGLLVPPWPPRCHLSGARLCKRNRVREAGFCSAPLITPCALLRQSWPSPESEGPQVRACHPPSGCFYQGELPGSAAAEREGGAF